MLNSLAANMFEQISSGPWSGKPCSIGKVTNPSQSTWQGDADLCDSLRSTGTLTCPFKRVCDPFLAPAAHLKALAASAEVPPPRWQGTFATLPSRPPESEALAFLCLKSLGFYMFAGWAACLGCEAPQGQLGISLGVSKEPGQSSPVS